MDVTKENILDMINDSNTKYEFYEKLGFTKTPNARMLKNIREILNSFDIDLNHKFKMKIYEYRTCPVCNKEFLLRKIEKKTTCSHACSNTHFRSGINNGSHQKAIISGNENSTKTYRTICFHYHEKKCVVCGEENIVAVHHYDENHSNNDPANLIPMCPTHHQYMHSDFKHLIEEQVHQYVLNWRNNNEI